MTAGRASAKCFDDAVACTARIQQPQMKEIIELKKTFKKH